MGIFDRFTKKSTNNKFTGEFEIPEETKFTGDFEIPNEEDDFGMVIDETSTILDRVKYAVENSDSPYNNKLLALYLFSKQEIEVMLKKTNAHLRYVETNEYKSWLIGFAKRMGGEFNTQDKEWQTNLSFDDKQNLELLLLFKTYCSDYADNLETPNGELFVDFEDDYLNKPVEVHMVFTIGDQLCNLSHFYKVGLEDEDDSDDFNFIDDEDDFDEDESDEDDFDEDDSDEKLIDLSSIERVKEMMKDNPYYIYFKLLDKAPECDDVFELPYGVE